jgi:hypothetical protein
MGWGMQRSEYLELRRRFKPERISLVIVAESTPVSGRYFYNPTGKLSEPLFMAMMTRLRFTPPTALDPVPWQIVLYP